MANITIDNLHPAGSELFADTEGYLNDLTTDELGIWGGIRIANNNLSIGLTGINATNVSIGQQQGAAGQGNPRNNKFFTAA